MAYNAELQMLREFYLLYAARELCFFCHKPIYASHNDVTFGHRRHTKVWELNFTVHHDDENRENNADSNLKGCHSTCHRRYHKQLLLAAGRENSHAGQTVQQEREGSDEEEKEREVR
jgi:hypothetical protein